MSVNYISSINNDFVGVLNSVSLLATAQKILNLFSISFIKQNYGAGREEIFKSLTRDKGILAGSVTARLPYKRSLQLHRSCKRRVENGKVENSRTRIQGVSYDSEKGKRKKIKKKLTAK